MAEIAEQDDKTEDATEKKLRDAAESGDLPVSREAPLFAGLAFASNVLPLNFGIWAWFLGGYFLQTLGVQKPPHPLLQAIQDTMEGLIASGKYKPGGEASGRDQSTAEAG